MEPKAPVIHPPPTCFTEEQLKTDPVLKFFHYAHLPEGPMRNTSEQFCRLAWSLLLALPRNAERTKCFNKLLEAKDCAVRTWVP